MDEVDVVVVGAGLAGLQCAQSLRDRGLTTVVLEAGDAPGGRVRTDVVDGFRCDRGFQLLNPAYPALRRHVDLGALDLGIFGRGVVVAQDDGSSIVADPLRHPWLLGRTLRSGYVRPLELGRLLAWLAPALGSVPRLLAGPDRSRAESLAAAGVSGRLGLEVLEPFLTGVLAEDDGSSSATFVRLLLRSFVRATPGVPGLGMQALPDQLARGLDLRLRTRVTEIRGPGEVRSEVGSHRAGAVVVATDPVSAAELAPIAATPMKGLRTWWFTTGQGLTDPTFLRVDGHRAGPVVNSAVLSAVAPSYAPVGRHLVQATTLLPSDSTEADVRRHLERLWSVATGDWDLVTVHDVAHALPRQPAPAEVRRPVNLGGGLFVAGDHRDTGSIQGALVSGARAARAVAASLGSRR
ncbi:NAD(P)/FAD-dependent oxidoreductase [Nocardioides lianchengensis]|uniref:NAD(P)/FAD-dependent oxidoreductase n=1 Tax=Nocardioides lianchengensis TaxID=1045774 RepID=UPI000B87843F|nr:NAD(P)/FAD-dependent oxidoreductase [Nocardioides lianchengensis]NYG10722.1 phytoene dehydrogenase-like protein [Nocardioides lianchengensis]